MEACLWDGHSGAGFHLQRTSNEVSAQYFYPARFALTHFLGPLIFTFGIGTRRWVREQFYNMHMANRI